MVETLAIITFAALAVAGLAALILVLCFVASGRGAAPGFEERIPSLNR
jgi:hypothetical protein